MRAGLVKSLPSSSLSGHYTVPVAPDADILVEITALAPGGDGVGRQQGGEHDGRVTFVPLAAPGEVVRAKVVRGKARVVWAELTAVETPSPARVVPPCPLFGRCGGCQWQHVDPAVQRLPRRGQSSRGRWASRSGRPRRWARRSVIGSGPGWPPASTRTGPRRWGSGPGNHTPSSMCRPVHCWRRRRPRRCRCCRQLAVD